MSRIRRKGKERLDFWGTGIDRQAIRMDRGQFSVLMGVFLWAASALGQPVCDIDIGGDQTICQGQTITLQGPDGYTNYLWSTGETTQDIDVGTAGDYWCQVSYPSGELVTNGDFSAGNTGFTSQYTYSLFSVQNEGYYTVGPNASWYHNQFQGTGNGNFLIANGGWVAWSNNQVDVWCQTIPCCPGQTYLLSFRGLTLTNETPVHTAWYMDGAMAHWPDFTFPAYNAGWQTFTTTWTAGPNQTSVNACIRVTSGNGVGDDFGIDDISISGMIYLRDTLNVAVTPLPIVDLGPAQTLCDGDMITLDATQPGASYLWQDGSTSATLQVTQGGTYSVEVTAQGCTGTGQVDVQYNSIPQVDIGSDQIVCPGDAATFDATTPGATYLWSTGSTAPILTTDQPGIYNVEVTVNGCTGSDEAELSNFILHSVDLGPDQAFCEGESVRIGTQVAGATYLWNTGATTDSITVSSPGIHWLDATLNGCTVRDTIIISEIPLPVVDLGPDQQVCPGGTVQLDATTTGGSYLWSNGATTATVDAGLGSWTVDVTVNGCTGYGTVTITEHAPPTVDLGPDIVLCPGESLVLDVTQPGASYLWNTGHTGPTLTITSPTTASVTVTDANGCSASDAITITYANTAAVNLGPDVSFCAGSSVQIGTHVPGASYSWNTGATTDSIWVNTPGIYWLDVVLNGCTVRDSIEVTEKPVPFISLEGGLTLCPGETTTLDATTAGATYLWNNGVTTPIIDAGVGTWTVDVTLNGCTGTASTVINGHPAPSVDLGDDILLCPGESVVLDVTQPNASYLWSTGETSPAITVDSPGAIMIQLTDGNGCQATDAITISMADPGAVNLGPDLEFCQGTTAVIDATTAGALGYQWSTGNTDPVLTTDQPGTYWIAVLLGTCTVSDTIVLTEVVGPGIQLGNDTTLCPGTTLWLTVPGQGLQLQWQDGSQTDSFLVDQPGVYSVEATDGNGCTSTASIQVSYLQQGGFSLGADTTLCQGETLYLDAGLPNGVTQWAGASNATTPAITVSSPGTYIATTTVAGCSFSDTIIVQVVGPPQPDLGPDTSFCAGSSITLAITGNNLLWDNGSTANTRTIAQGGTYWVQVTADGCTATDSITVTEVPLPMVDLGADTSLCGNSTLDMDVSVTGGSYLWSDGSTAPVQALGAGTWSVQVTVSGCSSGDTITIQSIPLPVVELPSDTILCTGDSWLIDVGQPGASYLWTTGSTAPSLLVDAAGTYGVTVDRDGCSSSASVTIDFIDLSGFTLGPDTSLCPGSSLVLSVGVPGASAVWQDGSTAIQRTVTTAGTYAVTVTVAGCSAQDQVQVDLVELPPVNLGPDQELCTGDTLHLEVDPGAAQILWSTGAGGPEIDITTGGHYTVTLSLDGCSVSDAVLVSLRPVDTHLGLGPDLEICPGATIMLDAFKPGATAYLWNDASTKPTLAVTEPGTYSVLVTGYCMEAEATVRVTEGICGSLVYVPNAFTPDADGRNDIFRPVVDQAMMRWTFRVFNRWGLLVFSTEDTDEGWDGTFNGMEAPQDVYIWELRYKSLLPSGLVQEHLRGHVTLVR